MVNYYQNIYPEAPLLKSSDLGKPSAMDLLSLEFFEAEPGEMPSDIFAQHHILINLCEKPMRVKNWRGDECRDFTYNKNEIIVTPAGVKSGWQWYKKSKCIVITIEPEKLRKFTQYEVGIFLDSKQLKDIPQFIDEDITNAAVMLMNALKSDIGSDVMFESFARIFLIKLIQKYGLQHKENVKFNKTFNSKHYKRVLDYVCKNFQNNIDINTLAKAAGLSSAHFSRMFKQTIGCSPHQFIVSYRIEQSKKMMVDLDRPMTDIALSCGFSDQAHFSRLFKKLQGQSPHQWRKNQ